MSAGKLHLLPFGPAEESVLVAQIRKGAPDAFEVLYQRYIGRVLGVATQLLGDRASAQDVAQETFFKVFADIDRFRGEGRLIGWIHRIAVNLSISELRRRSRLRRNQAQLPEGAFVASNVRLPELSESLRSVLGRLDPIKRITFYLHHVEGLTGAEIAEAMGESRDAVLKRLQRARRELLLLWEEPDERAAERSRQAGGES